MCQMGSPLLGDEGLVRQAKTPEFSSLRGLP